MTTKTDFRRYIHILEAHDRAYRIDLPYDKTELSPSMSKETIDLHYGTLHKNYVDKALDGIDYEWNIAGAQLHNKFFEQFRTYYTPNKPSGASRILIEENWSDYDDFRAAFTESALGIKGSGWCYLSTNGEIKIIPNHKATKNIALIVDMWEHAYVLDYGSQKEKYLNNFWRIINWDVVSTRIET